jgi:peptide/nickel transport system permease protein
MMVRDFVRLVAQSKLGLIGLVVFLFFAIIAIFAPYIAPYKPFEKSYNANEVLERLDGPSRKHLFGTTIFGRDVFSQVIWGFRPAFIIGLSTAIGVILIGVNIGLIAGYYGGWIDNLLMRLTDIAWGVPFLPFTVVVLSMFRKSLGMIVFVMVIIMWRTTARVIRSQVLTLKGLPFVDAARISGANDLRIIYFEIAPNILPLALVNTAFALASAIITEASISFLGFGDPDLISWGTIIYRAFSAQMIGKAWWWVVPPGVAIMALVTSVYFIGRAYEEIVNPRLKKI